MRSGGTRSGGEAGSAGRRTLRLAFVGDVCLAREARAVARARGADHLLAAISPVLARADLTVANLECVLLAERNVPRFAAVAMATDDAFAEALARVPFHVLGLANNHILDAGAEGLGDTIEALRRCGLAWFGAGANRTEAESLRVVQRRGWRVGFLGGCDVTRVHAGSCRPGVASADPSRLLRRVRAARAAVELVVVVLHADLEFADFAQPRRVALSRALVDAGADLVVSHHPHVVQGVERRGEGLIAYSLGNCVFPVRGNEYLESRPHTREGIVLEVEATPSRISAWRAHPFRIDDEHRPVPLEAEPARAPLDRIASISKPLGDPTSLRRAWRDRCRVEAKQRLGNVYWSLRRGRVADALSEIVHVVRSAEERRWIVGLLSGGAR